MRAMTKNTAGNHITPCYILDGANLQGEKPPFRTSPLVGPVERELRLTLGVGFPLCDAQTPTPRALVSTLRGDLPPSRGSDDPSTCAG